MVGRGRTLSPQLVGTGVTCMFLGLRDRLNNKRKGYGGVTELRTRGVYSGSARLNLWHAEAYYVGCVRSGHPLLERLLDHHISQTLVEAICSYDMVQMSVAICSIARERGGPNEGQQRVCEARGRRGNSSPRRASCRIFHSHDSYVEC